MSVYTGRGDEGNTDLFSGERVSKSDHRIEAYGAVDELNSLLGMVISSLDDSEAGHEEFLVTVQNHLHTICASLANSETGDEDPDIKPKHVNFLEDRIDLLEEELPQLQAFILPGGSDAGSTLHYARSVCRRAERTVVEAHQEHSINPTLIKYINRLSDALFVEARSVNHERGKTETNPSYD
ncbi:MAG: cob(I)yrinic acid a,c-diamide adenosyltransferase [bacterium]